MTFSQFMLILRARRNIILFILLMTVTTVMSISLLMPKAYKATATVVLNPGVDPVTGIALPGQLVPSYLATQVGIIGSRSVALKVVQDLKLDRIAENKEKFQDDTKGRGNLDDWLAAQLLKKLDVAPTRESNVVDVSFTHSNPQSSASVANAFAAAYQQINMELRLEPVKKASIYFNDQIKAHRNNLEVAQNKLSKYQQEKGIANLDSSLDVETVRLNELSTQLVTVQGQLMEAQSRQGQANGNAAAESPDVLANPTIQNIRLSLVQAEAKFSQVSQQFTDNHPRYQEAKAEVDKLRSELRSSMRTASTGLARNAVIFQQRESELSTALAAQKAKVLELNRARDELAVLAKEVESSQRAYDNVLQRLSQSSLEGQSRQSEVAILSPATSPFKHSSPKLSLNLLLSVLAGTILGLGFGMLAEMKDRRVRSASDLQDVLQAPVLGTVAWGRPKRLPGVSRWRLPRPLLSN